MSCQFCLGFAKGSRAPRRNVSLFEGEDDLLNQAIERAEQLREDASATNLRMFFCLEVAQMLARRKCEQIADTCNLNGVVTPPWLVTKIEFNHEGIRKLRADIAEFRGTLTSLDLEMRIIKEGRPGATHADLYSSGLSAPLDAALASLREVAKKIDLASRSTSDSYSAVGKACADLFTKLDAMPQDYITILTIMFSITATETVSPWSTKIPFL
jgi:hypothetical protein